MEPIVNRVGYDLKRVSRFQNNLQESSNPLDKKRSCLYVAGRDLSSEANLSIQISQGEGDRLAKVSI